MVEDLFRLPESGQYPWTKAEYAMAGWVPNVSGHLSFNLLDPKHKNPTYNHQCDLSQPRTVAVYRSRVAQDFPFPDFLVRLFRPSAVPAFVLLAESSGVKTPFFNKEKLDESDDRNGLLMGIVAVLPNDANLASRCSRWRLIASIKDIISEAGEEKAAGVVDPDRRLARELLTKLEAARSDLACHFIRFALFRTGELRLWYDLDGFLGRDLVQDPATARERMVAESLAPQAYYFIKDLLHAHYHHDPTSDQLLPLTATATNVDASAQLADDTAWRYATVRGLTRVVVELRQGGSVAGHQQAKGIIAYANAFQTVLARIRRGQAIGQKHCDESPIIYYDFSNLLTSLDAKDASAQSQTSAQLQLFAILVGILLSGLALWAGAVQIQPILCESLELTEGCPRIEAGPLTEFVNWIVVNPLPSLGYLLAGGVLIFVAWFRGTNAIPWVSRGTRWLRRLAEAFGTQISRLLTGFDIIGWLASLALLGSVMAYSIKLAIEFAPTNEVPPVELRDQRAKQSPWAPLYSAADTRIDRSGILVRSIVAPELRSRLKDRYPAFVEAFGPGAIVRRSGDVLLLTSGSSPGTDGGYLLLDPRIQAIEAGLWTKGILSVHRTPGKMLGKPQQLRDFLGSAGESDVGPIPLDSSVCDFERGGTDGRTVQLSGKLRAMEFCEYAIELQAGQSISFDPTKSKGLELLVRDGQVFRPIGSSFTAVMPMRQPIRLRWAGWNPKPADAPKPRPFYIRLSVH